MAWPMVAPGCRADTGYDTNPHLRREAVPLHLGLLIGAGTAGCRRAPRHVASTWRSAVRAFTSACYYAMIVELG